MTVEQRFATDLSAVLKQLAREGKPTPKVPRARRKAAPRRGVRK